MLGFGKTIFSARQLIRPRRHRVLRFLCFAIPIFGDGIRVFVQILGHLSGYSSNRNHAFGALLTFLQMVTQKITLAADNGQFMDKNT
jgi:hypothetical protein